jgi:putative transposase y4bL/y4kJ/y4tB
MKEDNGMLDYKDMWCEENEETAHFTPIIAQTMEVDFAGKTFEMTDRLTGEVSVIVVFVAVLPYSQMIYAEGMISAKEPQWIQVNNNALAFYGGVPALVVCDNCKQAVIANEVWIQPELNKDCRLASPLAYTCNSTERHGINRSSNGQLLLTGSQLKKVKKKRRMKPNVSYAS